MDKAGNVLQEQTPLGTVTMTYDALNRLTKRVVPGRKAPRGIINSNFPNGLLPGQEVYYPYFRRQISGSNYSDTLTIFDDSSTFTYDKMGNITLAVNSDARVQRSYYPNGLLKADTLRLARYTFMAAPAAPVYDGSQYAQVYEYDLSGRRTKRTDSNFNCTGCFQQYSYNPQSGFLDWTEDKGSPGGSVVRFNFEYDAAGRLMNRFTNGNASTAKVSVAHTYDADGQLSDRLAKSGANPGSATTVYSDVHLYDGRGKKVKTSSVSGLTEITADYWESIYDGIGSLIATGRKRNGNPTADVNIVDALGNVMQRISDSTMSVEPKHVDFGIVGDQISSIIRPPHVINSGATDSTRTEAYFYPDPNGNQEREEHLVWKVQVSPPNPPAIPLYNVVPLTGHSYAWMTYGRDNRLRYAQRTTYEATGKRSVFTEYRYDALGRRVLARARRDTLCAVQGGSPYTCQSTIDRFIWDGDQLVAESRGNGAQTQSETSLNQEGGTGLFQGWVRYTHAGGIDEPLAVWSGNAEVAGIVPHFSWRGNVEAGSDITNGTLLESGSTPWIWPTRYKDINLAPELRGPMPEPTRWLGSLVENQIDFNGLAYRRNRYYNTSTGRFTSEDPIGLAGGLNLYGFADGDPVNFSDPFGLCPDPKDPACRFAFGGGRGPTTSIGATLAGIGGQVKNFVDSRIDLLTSPDAWAELGFGIIGSIGGSGPSSRFIGGARAVSFGRMVGTGTVDLAPTLQRIASGERGSAFNNNEGLLPLRPDGYYSKFVVPTPGVKGAGPMRLIVGGEGDQYLTTDHYKSFTRVNPPRP